VARYSVIWSTRMHPIVRTCPRPRSLSSHASRARVAARRGDTPVRAGGLESFGRHAPGHIVSVVGRRTGVKPCTGGSWRGCWGRSRAFVQCAGKVRTVRTARARMSGLGSDASCEKSRQSSVHKGLETAKFRRRRTRKGRGDLDEGVDGHNGEVRLALGVIDEIEIDKLLQLQIWSLESTKMS
jgi:hypothetical protein